MGRDPRHTYYKVLMLAENADAEIISAVYRKLAQRYHPDNDSSAEAARRMAEINEAYTVLRDPGRRREYDAWLASRRDRRKNDRLILRPGDVPYGEVPVRPSGPRMEASWSSDDTVAGRWARSGAAIPSSWNG